MGFSARLFRNQQKRHRPFASHIALIVSVPVAQQALDNLMSFWRTEIGTYLLATALAAHVLNALWSVYVRRHLRLPAWELAQLSLGLSIPPLLMLHIVGTKISDRFLGTASAYHSVLILQWVATPWLVYLQFAAVLTVWTHACVGLHFWLRTKRWYRVAAGPGGARRADPLARACRLRRRRKPGAARGANSRLRRQRIRRCA